MLEDLLLDSGDQNPASYLAFSDMCLVGVFGSSITNSWGFKSAGMDITIFSVMFSWSNGAVIL
jgi:hypothetical protein